MRNIYSRRRYESVEDGDTYDVSEVINYVLERMEDAFPCGDGYYDYDYDPIFYGLERGCAITGSK